MKLIIDIPEEFYEALRKKTYVITSGQRSGKTLTSVIYDAIGNGTPLPKEYNKILKSVVNNIYTWYCPDCGARMVVKNDV